MHGTSRGIWLISDGIPGEYNQSLAVAEVLTRKGYGPILWIEARRIRGFLRRPVSWLVNTTRRPLPRLLEAVLIKGALPRSSPQLVISSNMKTAHANVIVSRRYRAPNVYIGAPRHIVPHHFSVIMHTRQDWSPGNGMPIDILPTRLSAAAARARSAGFRAELGVGGERVCAMLIGGNSRGHLFRPDEWRALAQGMNRLARQPEGLVTTSRRTGADAEAILRAGLDPALMADATWWGAQPRPVVVPYLSVGEVVFCTHDSGTMLSEAVASESDLPSSQRCRRYGGGGFRARLVAQSEVRRRLRRVPIAGVGEIDLAGDLARFFQVVTADVTEAMVERLLALLETRSPAAPEVPGRASQRRCQTSGADTVAPNVNGDPSAAAPAGGCMRRAALSTIWPRVELSERLGGVVGDGARP
jgi:mitochondrial fission protein ELM1